MDCTRDPWDNSRRRRWIRPNAHLYIRHDAYRFGPPGTPLYAARDVVKYFWPEPGENPSLAKRRDSEAEAAEAFDRELAELRRELNALKAEMKFRRLLRDLKYGFNPNQPRVPAGSGRESGRWAGEGETHPAVLSDVTPDNEAKPGGRYAAAKLTGPRTPSGQRPRAGRPQLPTLGERLVRQFEVDRRLKDVVERVQQIDPDWKPTTPSPSAFSNGDEALARREVQAEEARARLVELGQWPPAELMAAYRANSSQDLFGRQKLSDNDTVSVAIVDGEPFFGVNSTARAYTLDDRFAARQAVSALVEKYPNVMQSGNVGEGPNDALYHAEATVLLRLARANDGTLAGRTLEVHVDRAMCVSCDRVLPLIGLEVGNPTVTYVDSMTGERMTMRDGRWIFGIRP